MQITKLVLPAAGLSSRLKLALASDLHGEKGEKAILSLKEEKPDLILMPGDIFDFAPELAPEEKRTQNSLAFLSEAGKIAPCFFSVGNHEWVADETLKGLLRERDVALLDDAWEPLQIGADRILVGGLTSPCGREEKYSRWNTQRPDVAFLRRFAEKPGYKILLSHHPELFPPYIEELPVDLTLSGHAHGGQIRLFGKGLFAPGQGFFPALTSGIYKERLIVSRGLGNGTPFPRLFNPRELIYVELCPKA